MSLVGETIALAASPQCHRQVLICDNSGRRGGGRCRPHGLDTSGASWQLRALHTASRLLGVTLHTGNRLNPLGSKSPPRACCAHCMLPQKPPPSPAHRRATVGAAAAIAEENQAQAAIAGHFGPEGYATNRCLGCGRTTRGRPELLSEGMALNMFCPGGPNTNLARMVWRARGLPEEHRACDSARCHICYAEAPSSRPTSLMHLPPRRGPRPPAKGGWGRASTAPTLRCWLRGRPAEFHALACSHGYISPQQGHPMPGLAGLRPSNPPKPALKALRSRRKQVSTGETGALVGTKRRRSATQLRLSNGSAAPEGIWVTLYRCSHATAKRMRKALVQTLASGNAIAGVKQSRMQGEERTLCFCMHVALTLATTHATNRRKLQVFRANALPHCALNLSV